MRPSFTAGAVVYAKDIDRVSAFYAEVAALAITHAEHDHVRLGDAGFELVIVRIPAALAESIHISTPPQRREDTPVKLVFPAASIEQARVKAQRLGGEMNPPAREWEWHGHRVCDGHDPEGNVFQLRECLA